MKVLAAVFLAILLLFAVPARAQVQEPRGFDKTASDATLALYGIMPDPADPHHHFFQCSAFIFQKDATGYFILSAGHCVSEVPKESTFGVAEYLGGEIYPVTVVGARLEGAEDYSEFHLTTTKVYPVLELGSDSTEYVGSAILNPNFAYGLGKQLARGVISSQRLRNSEFCGECAGEFLIQEIAGPGASGSPVISATTHKVIAILQGEWIGESGGSGDGFFGEPTDSIQHSFTLPNQYEDLHQLVTKRALLKALGASPDAN